MSVIPSRPARRSGGRASIGVWGSRQAGHLACYVALGVALAGTNSAWAGPVGVTGPGLQQPTSAADLGDAARSIADVEQAVKSFEKRDFDACLQQLVKAVKAHPELPPPHALFAKLAFLSNQGAMIRPSLERSVAEDAEHPEVYILFGNLALVEGRPTDAAVHLEKARALATSRRWTAEQRRRFERLCHQGNAFLAESRGDWKAAHAALVSWLEQEPANARARYRLGKALFGLGQYEQAHAELLKAAEGDPAIEPPAITMGWLYTGRRDPKKAGEWMDYAVKADPDSLRVRMGVASWLLEQGRAEEAQSQAEAAAKLDPKSIEVKRMLGLTARERKEFARSEEILQALALESPGDAWLRNQLALVLVEQSDDAKRRRALELAELSVRQNPNAADALATLGTVYYRLKRLDDAEKLLQAVLNSGKGNSDAAYILALVKSDRGHAESAPALLQTALSAPGLFVFRKDAQQWLDRLTTTSK
jgi:tetratricopeptide (TPR) repeat protein